MTPTIPRPAPALLGSHKTLAEALRLARHLAAACGEPVAVWASPPGRWGDRYTTGTLGALDGVPVAVIGGD